jgi:hypothetical protein
VDTTIPATTAIYDIIMKCFQQLPKDHTTAVEIQSELSQVYTNSPRRLSGGQIFFRMQVSIGADMIIGAGQGKILFMPQESRLSQYVKQRLKT